MPGFWHAARSVANRETGQPWIRLGLRGERTVGDTTRLTFRYRLTGADAMKIGLVNVTAKATQWTELKGLAREKRMEATVNFDDARPGERVSAITWQLPGDAELLIDDVLLYEPGS